MTFLRNFLISRAQSWGPAKVKSLWKRFINLRYFYLLPTITVAAFGIASFFLSSFPLIILAVAAINFVSWAHIKNISKAEKQITEFEKVLDFEIAISSNKSLKKIEYINTVINSEVAIEISRLLRSNLDIRRIHLRGCKLSCSIDEFDILIDAIIERLDCLISLDLSGIRCLETMIVIDYYGLMSKLTKALRDNKKIARLRLPISVCPSDIINLLNYNNKLVELSIDGWSETQESIDLQLISAISRNKSLKIIKIPRLLLSDATISVIEELLSRDQLNELHIHNCCYIPNNDVKVRFANALQYNSSLISVGLSSRSWRENISDVLLFANALLSNSSITAIRISSVDFNINIDDAQAMELAEAISRKQNIRSINLSRLVFSTAGIRIIGAALGSCTRLREVILDDIIPYIFAPPEMAGDEFITTFVSATNSLNNLDTLSLLGTPLGTTGDGVTQIARTISDRQSKLQHINISLKPPGIRNLLERERLKREATSIIADALISSKSFTPLRSIGIRYNSLIYENILQRAIDIVNEFRAEERLKSNWNYFAPRLLAWSSADRARKTRGEARPFFESGKKLPELPDDIVQHIQQFVDKSAEPLRLITRS